MNTTTTTRRPFPKFAALFARSRAVRRIGAVLAAVGIAAALGAGSASAAVTPVYYSGTASCAGITGYYGDIGWQRPQWIANYTGTSAVVFAAEVEKLQNGVWVNDQTLYSRLTAWQYSGVYRTNLFWGGTNNDTQGIGVPAGQYRIYGVTMWANSAGTVFYYTTTYLGGCTF